MTGDARLEIETPLGAIEIAVHVGRAPITATYVRQLVADGAFTDASFYRSTTLGRPDRQPLIQGGPLASVVVGADTPQRKVAMLDSIETTEQTGLRHRAGTVSLARDLFRTGHVLPELFICLDEYPDLDAGGRTEPDERGFPAFGTVTAGDDVVSAIADRDTGGASSIEHLRGEILTHPVRILNLKFTAPSIERDD